jgi:hypothetical protein
MNDHRLARNVGERLPRQARCPQARRNYDQGPCHMAILSFLCCAKIPGRFMCRLTGLRQFALRWGFFCVRTYRIGKVENHSSGGRRGRTGMMARGKSRLWIE